MERWQALGAAGRSLISVGSRKHISRERRHNMTRAAGKDTVAPVPLLKSDIDIQEGNETHLFMDKSENYLNKVYS